MTRKYKGLLVVKKTFKKKYMTKSGQNCEGQNQEKGRGRTDGRERPFKS